jgi:hypothetical protein
MEDIATERIDDKNFLSSKYEKQDPSEIFEELRTLAKDHNKCGIQMGYLFQFLKENKTFRTLSTERNWSKFVSVNFGLKSSYANKVQITGEN